MSHPGYPFTLERQNLSHGTRAVYVYIYKDGGTRAFSRRYDDEKAIERAEGDRRNSEEVHRGNRFPVITEKGKPASGGQSFGEVHGGSLGFADPAAGVGYAYVTSQMGTQLTGDPRDVALRDALYSAIQVSSSATPVAAKSL